MSRSSHSAESSGDQVPQELPNSWFALQVRTCHEKVVAKTLAAKGFDEFLPVKCSRRRWYDRFKEIEVPLFPGYVFCRFDARDRLRVATTPGVMKIVGAGRQPLPVDNREIRALQRAIQGGLNPEPHEFVNIGMAVTIDEGPLRGLEGVLVQVNNRRKLVLSVSLLKRSVSVEIDQRDVVPSNGSYTSNASSWADKEASGAKQTAGEPAAPAKRLKFLRRRRSS